MERGLLRGVERKLLPFAADPEGGRLRAVCQPRLAITRRGSIWHRGERGRESTGVSFNTGARVPPGVNTSERQESCFTYRLAGQRSLFALSPFCWLYFNPQHCYFRQMSNNTAMGHRRGEEVSSSCWLGNSQCRLGPASGDNVSIVSPRAAVAEHRCLSFHPFPELSPLWHPWPWPACI